MFQNVKVPYPHHFHHFKFLRRVSQYARYRCDRQTDVCCAVAYVYLNQTHTTTMSKYSNLALAKAFVGDPRITVTTSFFGFSEKATYIPTQSRIIAVRREYTPEIGQTIVHALRAEAGKQAALLAALGHQNDTSDGNYQLEVCYAEDMSFAAMRLYQYEQLQYRPVSEICTFEGPEAAEAIKIL